MDKVLEGDSSRTLLADDNGGADDNKVEEGESKKFQEWLKRCEEEHRHFYVTNIHTGSSATAQTVSVAGPYPYLGNTNHQI
eukprot:971154-Pyramimonas_sp.AAC.1